MYANIRDGLSVLLGIGFIGLSISFLAGAIEVDAEKYNPLAPMILGVALLGLGAVPIARRRRRAREERETESGG